MCSNCRAFITTEDKVCPYCDFKVGARAVDARTPSDALGGLIPQAHFTTVVILLINAGLYIAGTLTGNNVLDQLGAKYGPLIREGEWWRLITAGFLHGGLLHIAMNSWVLFDLGAQTEENYGTSRFLVFYILSTITGFYASMLWAPLTPSVGSSAGIFGLIGAMIALGVRDQSVYGSAVKRVYTQWAIFALVMSFFPGIDMAAHLGGLAGGFALGYLAGAPKLGRPAIESFWKVAAVAVVALTVAAFAMMSRGLLAGAQQ